MKLDNQQTYDSLKGCDNGWFIISILCWTLSIVWGVFDTQ